VLYDSPMIRSFRHKGLQRLFEGGSKRGIHPAHAEKLKLRLTVLNSMVSVEELPSAWKPHRLSGEGPKGENIDGHFSTWVSGNWRITFDFHEGDVTRVDYMDYH
jgi:toxin HigB-1